MRTIEPTTGGARVVTDRGIIVAGQAVVAAGAWVKKLLPELPVPPQNPVEPAQPREIPPQRENDRQ